MHLAQISLYSTRGVELYKHLTIVKVVHHAPKKELIPTTQLVAKERLLRSVPGWEIRFGTFQPPWSSRGNEERQEERKMRTTPAKTGSCCSFTAIPNL